VVEKLLNKKEIAEALGVSVKAIDKWVCEQKIPYIKISQKCVRFVPEQIRAFLNKHRITPAGLILEDDRRPRRRPQKRVTKPKRRR
jgi:predicted DNA-binding transcriptional regulator AlpA